MDLLAVLDAVVVAMRSIPQWPWKATRVTTPSTDAHAHTLASLACSGTFRTSGQRVCVDVPWVVLEAIDGEYTAEPVSSACEFVGVARADVAATIQDGQQCSVRVRVAAVIVGSLMGQARFLVSSKGRGIGHVVDVGVVSCEAILRIPNVVIMWSQNVGSASDAAGQLHPGAMHEMLFVDVQFKTGASRRLYIELTPGQISGFDVASTKAAFWKPPAIYSKLKENPGYLDLDGYEERFQWPGLETYYDVVQKVCEEALGSELRQVPVDFVKRLM